MTLKEAIAQADDMRPNAISEEKKARWVYSLEARVAETMQVQVPPFTWPLEGEDEGATLLMPYPYDDIYHLYLCAQIDNYNQETDLYANDASVSNAATHEALAWWRRNNPPKGGENWRLAP